MRLCLALVLLTATTTALNAQVTVFEGARLITGDGSAPMENAVFVVDGARFLQVGRAGQVQVPAGATRVSLAGKTVMPTIIDTHTHLDTTTRAGLVAQLERKAFYGVGLAVSLGRDTGAFTWQLRESPAPGAARIHTSGRGITSPEPGRSAVPYWITTEAEGRKAVQELAVLKVDLVKIWVDDRNGQFKKLGPELYRAVIDEAHKHGLRVTAHIVYLDDAKDLLRAGLDAFAHGVRDRDIDDEFVAMMKQRPNVVLVPNLPAREPQEAFGIQARNLAKLNAAGVKIALGTDGSASAAHQQEMEDMVAAGMTPTQVIVAATRGGAELLRLTDVGTIAAGMSADFLVLDANPLDDMANVRRISSVYLRGTALDRAAIRP